MKNIDSCRYRQLIPCTQAQNTCSFALGYVWCSSVAFWSRHSQLEATTPLAFFEAGLVLLGLTASSLITNFVFSFLFLCLEIRLFLFPPADCEKFLEHFLYSEEQWAASTVSYFYSSVALPRSLVGYDLILCVDILIIWIKTTIFPCILMILLCWDQK